MPRAFLLDNLDSFTYNLAQQFESLGAEVEVRRASEFSCINDLINHVFTDRVASPPFTHIVLSPGPMRPEDHPANAALLEVVVGKLPVLGVCLGMQAINAYFGGTLRRDHPPLHGKTSPIRHTDRGLFTGQAEQLEVARYHSLVIDQIGDGLEAVAWTHDDRIMAIQHRELPVYGVQFHPESFLSPCGDGLMQRFLEL